MFSPKGIDCERTCVRERPIVPQNAGKVNFPVLYLSYGNTSNRSYFGGVICQFEDRSGVRARSDLFLGQVYRCSWSRPHNLDSFFGGHAQGPAPYYYHGYSFTEDYYER